MLINHKSKRQFVRSLFFPMWRFRYRALADSRKILRISPGIVKYSLPIGLGPKQLGPVADGDWDLIRTRFSDKVVYAFYEDHLLRNKTFDDTDLFRYWFAQLKAGKRVHGCESIEQLMAFARKHQKLIESLRLYGVVEPEQLQEDIRTDERSDFIRVNIGRTGEFIFGPGGTNRLAIAKILELESIPVQVCTRHAQWQRVRERVFKLYRGFRKPREDAHPPHPDIFRLEHPDLQDLMPKRDQNDWSQHENGPTPTEGRKGHI